MPIHQFLTGLPTAISRQLRATGEATELDKVVERARLLLTINNQEPLQSVAATGTSAGPDHQNDVSTKLMEQMETLTQQVAALTV